MVGLIQKILFDLLQKQGGNALVEQVKKSVSLDADYNYRINAPAFGSTYLANRC